MGISDYKMVKKGKEKEVKKISEKQKETVAKSIKSKVKTSKKSERREEEVKKRVKKRTKMGTQKFRFEIASYIYKIAKNLAPEFSISSKTLTLCNHLANTLFERIMQEAEGLVEIKGSTITSNTVKSAVKLVLSGKQLESHAMIQIQQVL